MLAECPRGAADSLSHNPCASLCNFIHKVAFGGSGVWRPADRRGEHGVYRGTCGADAEPATESKLQLPPTINKHLLTSLFAVAIACGLSICFIPYPKKVEARGSIGPVGGALSLRAPSAGVVSEVLVAEGQTVRQGTPILKLSLDQDLLDGARGELEARVADAESAAERQKLNVEYVALSHQVGQTREAQTQALRLVALLDQREAIALEQVKRNRETLDKGRAAFELKYVSGNQWRLWQAALAQSETTLLEVREQRSRALFDLTAARQEGRRLEAQMGGQAADLRLLDAKHDQRKLEIEKGRRQLIVAPRQARVSSITANPGSSVAEGEQVAVLAPDQAPLAAELWLDARAIGFVEVGRSVILMYDAFPYQKYGSGHGRVLYVSRAPTSPPAPLSTSLPSAYKVVVSVESATVAAAGRRWPIPYGSTLTAKIILENKSVAAHLFSPLHDQ